MSTQNGPKALDFGAPAAQPAPVSTPANDGFAPLEDGFAPLGTAPVATIQAPALPDSIAIQSAPIVVVPAPKVIVSEDEVRRLGESTAGTSSAVSQRLLEAQRAGDSGEMGKLLNEVIREAKGLSPEQMAQKGLIGKLKGLFSRAQDGFMAHYDTVQGRIDTLVRQIEGQIRLHERRVSDLEDLRQANYNFYKSLKADTAKGEEMLIQIQAMIDYAKAQPMTDGFAANKVTEYEALYNMLEKRLDDFRRVMIISQQTDPQLVMMKANSHGLVDNFNTVKNTTIPVWRQMFAQYLISLDQKRGAALSKSIADTTDEALRKNSELLGQNAVAIAEARQRGVVSVERLEQVQRDLFATLDKVADIEKKGREDRKAAQPKLAQLEQELISHFANGRR